VEASLPAGGACVLQGLALQAIEVSFGIKKRLARGIEGVDAVVELLPRFLVSNLEMSAGHPESRVVGPGIAVDVIESVNPGFFRGHDALARGHDPGETLIEAFERSVALGRGKIAEATPKILQKLTHALLLANVKIVSGVQLAEALGDGVWISEGFRSIEAASGAQVQLIDRGLVVLIDKYGLFEKVAQFGVRLVFTKKRFAHRLEARGLTHQPADLLIIGLRLKRAKGVGGIGEYEKQSDAAKQPSEQIGVSSLPAPCDGIGNQERNTEGREESAESIAVSLSLIGQRGYRREEGEKHG
jgi:hypothetical protein